MFQAGRCSWRRGVCGRSSPAPVGAPAGPRFWSAGPAATSPGSCARRTSSARRAPSATPPCRTSPCCSPPWRPSHPTRTAPASGTAAAWRRRSMTASTLTYSAGTARVSVWFLLCVFRGWVGGFTQVYLGGCVYCVCVCVCLWRGVYIMGLPFLLLFLFNVC